MKISRLQTVKTFHHTYLMEALHTTRQERQLRAMVVFSLLCCLGALKLGSFGLSGINQITNSVVTTVQQCTLEEDNSF